MNKYLKLIGMSLTSNPRFWKAVAEAVIAAITAFVTALTTTSCAGYGPLW